VRTKKKKKKIILSLEAVERGFGPGSLGTNQPGTGNHDCARGNGYIRRDMAVNSGF